MFRIECGSASGGCDERAVEVCGGRYTPVQDGDAIAGAWTNYQTGQTTVARRRVMLVACGAPAAAEDTGDRRAAEAIWRAEPVDASPERRCAYFRGHLERAGRAQHDLRAWLRRQVSQRCNPPAVDPWQRDSSAGYDP
jgi:hypothetical protein